MIRWHTKILWGYFHFILFFLTKRLIFSQNIFLGQSFVKRSQIKNSLQMENLSIDHKVGLHAYISDNLGSQIHKLVSRWERVRKNKKKHAHKLWLNPYRETWINSLSIILLLKWWLTKLPEGSFVTYYTYACICLLFSIRELIGVITSNYRLVDNDFVKTCNSVQVTSISWYILNR